MAFTPIICVDFDGVIHSYSSGWHGVDVISDEPVPGAFEWLIDLLENASDGQPVPVVYSSRSKEVGGVRAMKEWFFAYGFPLDLLSRLEFPTQKPSAFLTIDDRAICFDGTFPSAKDMLGFKPWNKS